MDGNFPKKDRFPGTENTKDKKQNKPKQRHNKIYN